MKFTVTAVVTFGAGAILLYSGIKNVNPQDVVKQALGGKPAERRSGGGTFGEPDGRNSGGGTFDAPSPDGSDNGRVGGSPYLSDPAPRPNPTEYPTPYRMVSV